METTTIQVRKDQAEQLKEIARENGNYKTVIDRLLEGYNETTTEVVETDTIKEEVLDIVTGTSESEVQSADEIMRALETIEQRTGRLERQIEELGHS